MLFLSKALPVRLRDDDRQATEQQQKDEWRAMVLSKIIPKWFNDRLGIRLLILKFRLTASSQIRAHTCADGESPSPVR